MEIHGYNRARLNVCYNIDRTDIVQFFFSSSPCSLNYNRMCESVCACARNRMDDCSCAQRTDERTNAIQYTHTHSHILPHWILITENKMELQRYSLAVCVRMCALKCLGCKKLFNYYDRSHIQCGAATTICYICEMCEIRAKPEIDEDK